MQFGGSPRFRRYGYVLLFLVAVPLPSFAQVGQYGQVPGAAGQQACDSSTDPTCQLNNNGQSNPNNNYPIRNPSINPQQPLNPQIVVPGQQQIQNSTGMLNGNRTQTQDQNRHESLPLDPPTEFQLMIANSTGKALPIYGAKLFRNTPSTFAPLNLVPVPTDYVIGPGDELLVQVWGQLTLDGRFTVDRSGSIYIPQVGTMHVAGLSYGQLHDFLKAQMGRVFRNFDLNANMGQLRSIQVFVVGQARRPGTYTVSSLSTLVNALFVTGGPTPQGSLRDIQLKRGGKVVVDFDLYDLLQRGDKSKDAQLLPGDVIYIPPVGPQVAVAGSVNVPAIYELKTGEVATVGDVLGFGCRAYECRIGTNGSVGTRGRAPYAQYDPNIPGCAGTRYGVARRRSAGVDAVVSQYKDAVTLRGNVANPGRYTWKPGMRIRDLLPDKDALITRDYWLKRSQLGQPMMTYIPTCLPTSPYGIPDFRYGIAFGDEGENSNWRYSSTRNPNLIGLPFGTGEAGSYPV